MPTFDVRMRDGSIVEEYLPMSEMPEIGARVQIGKRVGVRVVSGAAPNQIDKRYAHAALHLPRNDPDAPHKDANGWAHFETKAEINEYAAKNPRFKWDA